jgi:hypothetical protein
MKLRVDASICNQRFRWSRALIAIVASLLVIVISTGSATAASCYDWTYRLPATQYQISPAQFTGSTITYQNVPVFNWVPEYTSTRQVLTTRSVPVSTWVPEYTSTRQVLTTRSVPVSTWVPEYTSSRTITSTNTVPLYEWRSIPSTTTTYEYRITGYTSIPTTTYQSVPVYSSTPVYRSYWWHYNYFRNRTDYCVAYSLPANCGSHGSGYTGHETSSRYQEIIGSRETLTGYRSVPTTTYVSAPVYAWVATPTTSYSWQQVQTGTETRTVTSTQSQVTNSYPSSPWIVTDVSYREVPGGFQDVQISTTETQITTAPPSPPWTVINTTYREVPGGFQNVQITTTETQITNAPPSLPWTVINTTYRQVSGGFQSVPVTSSVIVGQYIISSIGTISLSGTATGAKSWGVEQWVNTLPTAASGDQYLYSGVNRQIESMSSPLNTLLNSPTAPSAPAFSIISSNPRACVVNPT